MANAIACDGRMTRSARVRSSPSVRAEGVALAEQHVAKGSKVYADEAAHWVELEAKFPDAGRINHSEAYSADGANTNQAESFFARLRPHGFGPAPLHHRPLPSPVRPYGSKCTKSMANAVACDDIKILNDGRQAAHQLEAHCAGRWRPKSRWPIQPITQPKT